MGAGVENGYALIDYQTGAGGRRSRAFGRAD